MGDVFKILFCLAFLALMLYVFYVFFKCTVMVWMVFAGVPFWPATGLALGFSIVVALISELMKSWATKKPYEL